MTEWFENCELGIEQGFTLDTASGETVRRMPLRVTTELRPLLRPDADGVDFVDANGDAQLHYDGLHAFDADGKKLQSWIEVNGESNLLASAATHQLTLAVDTTGAKFPVTIDPVISLASERINHPELVAGDLFGVTVAAYGNLIAIGAPKHQVGPVPNAGVVYLFVRTNNCEEGWLLLQKIESPNPYNPGEFGRALSLGGGVLAVSAHRLAFVNGGDVLEDVVHVFQPSPTNNSVWTRSTTLKDSDPNTAVNPTNYFGYAISVNASRSRLAIGSPLAWSEGGPSPLKTGKVFLQERDLGGANAWGLVRTYQPTLFVATARFGRAVALDGNRLAVGAPGYFTLPSNTNGSVFVYDTSPYSPGVNFHEMPAPDQPGPFGGLRGFGERVALSGNQLAVAAPGAGAVVAFERRSIYQGGFNTEQWDQGILNPTGPFEGSVGGGGNFGSVLSLDRGTLIVGGGANPSSPGLKAVYRFEHQGDAGGNPALNWKRTEASPAAALNLRGIANAVIAGGLMVVTSTNDNYGGGIFNYGVGVALRRIGGTWTATQRFTVSPLLASNDLAGTSIAVSDDLLVVGAPGFDVGGFADSGAVHVFRRLSGLPVSGSSIAHGWTLASVIVNEAPQANGRLGESVAVRDGLIVAGAPGRNFASGTVWVWKRTSEAADVWAAETVLGAPSAAPGWRFGSAVSFNGSTLAAGSPFAGAGRAHLFQRGTNNAWPVLQTLLPHANDGRFGAALDLDEADNLIVGAPDASVNGAQSGEAYIYRRTETASGSEWIEEADPGSFVAGGHAGTIVAIDRGWAFVGAPGEVIDAGPPARSGRVRVFRRNHTAGDPWEQVAVIEAPVSTTSIAQFGSAIALDEHTAVIGAPGGTASGAAFVYSRVNGGAGDWRYTAKLLDSCNEAGDRFGSSVALDHDNIFVGAPKVDGLAAGNSGAVTLFERQGATWTLLHEVPDDSSHRIGSSAAVSGDWMVIGSTRDYDIDDEGPSDADQVYVLRRHDGANGAWNVVNKVLRPNLLGIYGRDAFGRVVDISDRVFVVSSTVGVYTFELQTDGQVTYLGPLVGYSDDLNFGNALAIHGQRVAVTANGSTTPGVRGSVVFFVRTNEHTEFIGPGFIQTSWTRERGKSSNARGFGASVDLSDTTAVVGAPDDSDLFSGKAGTVSVFERDRGGVGNWVLATSFTDPNVASVEGDSPRFGVCVSLDGDTVAVGTWFPEEDNGDGSASFYGGSASVFQRHAGGLNHWGKVANVGGGRTVAVSGDWVAGGDFIHYERDKFNQITEFPQPVTLHHRNVGGLDQWGLVQQFNPPNTNRTHTWDFGAAVALDGRTLVIGAPGELRALPWTPGRAFIYDVPLNSLSIWKDTLFAGQYFNGPITPYSGQAVGNLGDFDGDGILNAWEAYHGLNPFQADAPLAGLKSQGLNLATGEFVMRWREALDPKGLSVALQWSRNLGVWFASGQGPAVNDTKTFTITTVETHPDHVIKEARLPAGSDAKLFTRLVLVGQ